MTDWTENEPSLTSTLRPGSTNQHRWPKKISTGYLPDSVSSSQTRGKTQSPPIYSFSPWDIQALLGSRSLTETFTRVVVLRSVSLGRLWVWSRRWEGVGSTVRNPCAPSLRSTPVGGESSINAYGFVPTIRLLGALGCLGKDQERNDGTVYQSRRRGGGVPWRRG